MPDKSQTTQLQIAHALKAMDPEDLAQLIDTIEYEENPDPHHVAGADADVDDPGGDGEYAIMLIGVTLAKLP